MKTEGDRVGMEKEVRKQEKLGPVDIYPRDSLMGFFSSLLLFLWLKLKQSCFSSNYAFYFHIYKKDDISCPGQNCDLKHLMCVGEGKNKGLKPNPGGKMLMQHENRRLEFWTILPEQGKPCYKTNKLIILKGVVFQKSAGMVQKGKFGFVFRASAGW